MADRVLEVPDLDGLARLLTRELPAALDVPDATLLLWDRKLDSFQVLSSGGAGGQALAPGQVVDAPEARFLLSDGLLLETPPRQPEPRASEGVTPERARDGVLVPLLARSGLVGMPALGAR